MKYPTAMEEYFMDYGYHFNKKLFEFATDTMVDRNGNKLKVWDKEKTEAFLKANGVTVKNDYGHDAAYVLNMGRARYMGGSIADDVHLALFVVDYLDGRDAAETRAFDEFYIDSVAKGIPIFWDEMM